MKFALKDVVPNPFRDLQRFPLQQRKVSKLVESIRKSGWWENIVGRVVDGKFQAGHGHHRIAALRVLYKSTDQFEFIVKEKTDAEMIQMMALENDKDYGSDLRAVIETVRAVVQALADGSITASDMPPVMPSDTKTVRFAPSFVTDVARAPGARECPYTALSVARFLCSVRKGGDSKSGERASKRIDAALIALENIDLGLWTFGTLDALADKETKVLSANTVLKAGRECRTRAEHSRAKATLQVTAATTAAKYAQAQLNELRKKSEEARLLYEADVRRLADLVEEDNKKEIERLQREAKERQAQEKANEKENTRKLKEIEARVDAAQKRVNATAKSSVAYVPRKDRENSEANTAYNPNLTAALTWLKDVPPTCIFETLKNQASLKPGQSTSLKKMLDEAIIKLQAVRSKLK